MDNIYVVKETNLTIVKKPLALVFLYFDLISLQVRTKLKKLLKNTLNCWKLQIAFKTKTGLRNKLRFKNWNPTDLTSDVVNNFWCLQ